MTGQLRAAVAVYAGAAVVLGVMGCCAAAGLLWPAWVAIPLTGVGAGLMAGARPLDGGGDGC